MKPLRAITIGTFALTVLSSNVYADPYALKVAKETDLEMSCEELTQEALLMRDIIQTTETLKSEANLNGHAVTAAGAIGSFLIGSVTGGIGLAAAGFIANQQVEETADTAQDTQSIAQQRRALMIGIHKAKNCSSNIETAMAPVKSQSSLELSTNRLANIEPASGSIFQSDTKENYNQ